DEVDPGLHSEGRAAARFLDLLGQSRGPLDVEAEDVVGEPDVIRCDFALQKDELSDDVGWRAGGIAAAEGRLRAPVAGVGAAARTCHVPGELAVGARPGAAVGFDVQKVPRGWRQAVEVADGAARACGD